MVKKQLDNTDLKILRILQDEGRISNLDLAKKISMSPPPTLRRVRDFTIVRGKDEICIDEVKTALDLMDIDHLGLDRMDRKILSVIDEFYGGGPVGIEALCATLSEDRSTIEDVYEPYLLKEGFILRTPRGRAISEKTKNHLTSLFN